MLRHHRAARQDRVSMPIPQAMLKRLARLVVAVFYRRVDVVDAGNLPADRPAILALNHTNGLADSVVVIATTVGFPRFLAAASWWKFAPARWLFELAGVLPVHRRREGEDTRQNDSSFEACHEALAQGARIAIHPEGEMHQGPRLLPLRTGAARIALGASIDAGVGNLVIVPVAIVYSDRRRFRSQAALNVGEPIEVVTWSDRYRTDPEAAVRSLTEVIADGLRSVTINQESAHGLEVVERAAGFALADAADGTRSSPGYGARHALARAMSEAIGLAGGESSRQFQELEAAVSAHADDLQLLGVASNELRPLCEPLTEAEQRRDLEELIALTPIAALGAVANLPVAISTSIAHRLVRADGWHTTTVGALGTVLAPIVWGVEGVIVTRALGRRAGIVSAIAGPVGGWASILWHERWARRRDSAWSERVATQLAAEVTRARTSRSEVRRLVDGLLGTPTAAGRAEGSAISLVDLSRR